MHYFFQVVVGIEVGDGVASVVDCAFDSVAVGYDVQRGLLSNRPCDIK